MNPTTQATQPKVNYSESEYDKVNTLCNLGIYLENHVIDYETGNVVLTNKKNPQTGLWEKCPTKYQKRHLKRINDEKSLEKEMEGFLRVIESLKDRNKICNVTLYKNDNKDKTVSQVENPKLFMLSFKDNKKVKVEFFAKELFDANPGWKPFFLKYINKVP